MTGKGGLLFRSPSGEPLHAAVIQEELDRIAKGAGIPRLPFHGLRHKTPGQDAPAAEVLEQFFGDDKQTGGNR